MTMKKDYITPQVHVVVLPELMDTGGLNKIGSVVDSDTEVTEDHFNVGEDKGENSDWDWGGD